MLAAALRVVHLLALAVRPGGAANLMMTLSAALAAVFGVLSVAWPWPVLEKRLHSNCLFAKAHVMPAQEYKVVPAPTRPDRAMRRKEAEARHAATLTRLMNDMGAEGWEFVRAEALPAEERRGLFSRAVVTHHVLIFRREAVAAAPAGPAHAPGSPEDFAARASASLRNTPATRRFGGNAPPIGPARPDPRDLAAE